MRIRYIVPPLAILILAPIAVAYGLLHRSLPPLDGELSAQGLSAPVSVARDGLGIATIVADNRADLAYGTGFAHGQDRFFQMDLSRRLAAGELSGLVGSATLEQDQRARLFRFRNLAREVLNQTTPEQRAVVEAYTKGVNAGLASLGTRPWEYWVLREKPQQWSPEDTYLVVYAMWWDLQASEIRREMVRRQVNARIGGEECDAGWKCALQFFYPARTQWDAPNSQVASVDLAGVPPGMQHSGVPGPDALNVRVTDPSPATAWHESVRPSAAVGSNNWAVGGQFTKTGAALIADDMHLGQRVPTIWYRISLRTRGTADAPGLTLDGVSLPGAPLLVAGSNGHVAWGYTNSYGNWLNVSLTPCTADEGTRLLAASGAVPLTSQREVIQVHGADPVTLDVRTGPAGVLLRADPQRQQCWFASWLAQLPAATNMNLMKLEHARSVNEALALAPEIGIPHQNAVIGDRDGHIAWTIFGRIPTDVGAERTTGHSPWTTYEQHPRIVDPPAGRIWSANARVTADPRQEIMIGGDVTALGADYNLGARARQIRDDLLSAEGPATPADMLRIQLDDRASFLTPWRDLLLKLLDDRALQGHPQRAEFRKLIADWTPRASVDSVGYRLVRTWHDYTQDAVWRMLVRALKVPGEEVRSLPTQFEAPLWRLVTEQPMHMLSADYGSWNDFLLARLDSVIEVLRASCGELARCTWGSRQTVRIRHPLSPSLSILSPLLDMPTVQLPGDHDMPRVQDGAFGASERFAVSPGHEDQGYLHLPGGQSGHPLSPYYRAGFHEWASGEPLPFLPGTAEHTLKLLPQ